MIRVLLTACLITLFAAGCAQQQRQADAPVHWGTVIEATPSYMRETSSSTTPSVLGAVGGGVLGHQMGQGRGKAAMTGLGILVGGTAMANTSTKSQLVPATAVVVKDDKSGETYTVMLHGNWRTGMKIRFSLYPPHEAGSEYDFEVR